MKVSHLMFFWICFLTEIGVWIMFLHLYPWIHTTFFSHLFEAEMQTYLIGTAVGILFLSFWYWLSFAKICARYFKQTVVVRMTKPTLWIVTGGIFFSPVLFALFGFPLIQKDINEMAMITTATSFSLPWFYCIYFLCLLYFFLAEGILTFPFRKYIRIPPFIYHTTVIITIILLSFYVEYLSIFDHSNYAAPINDILHGKALLTFPALYGLMSMAVFSLIFRLIPLSLLNLTIVTAIGVTLGFIGVYVLGILLFRRRSMAIICVLTAIFANWLVLHGIRNSLPQQTVLRFGMWLPLAAAIFFSNTANTVMKHRVWNMLVGIVLFIGFFWTFDAGLYLVLAYVLFLWITSLRQTLWQTIGTFVFRLITVVGILAVGFLGIHLFVFLSTGQPPQWQNFIGSAFTYTQGEFWTIPMPQSVFPWLTVSLAWISIAILLSRRRIDIAVGTNPKISLMTFIACYAIMQFTYMLGRSTLNNLHVVAIPFVICLFFLIEEIITVARRIHRSLLLPALLFCSLILSFPLAFLVPQGLINLQGDIPTTIETIRHPRGTEEEYFGGTVRLIQSKFTAGMLADSIVLSIYEVWYNLLLDRTNDISLNCLICFFPPAPVEPLANEIREKNFRFLFVDHDRQQHAGQVGWVFNQLSTDYTYRETLGFLDVYERIK